MEWENVGKRGAVLVSWHITLCFPIMGIHIGRDHFSAVIKPAKGIGSDPMITGDTHGKTFESTKWLYSLRKDFGNPAEKEVFCLHVANLNAFLHRKFYELRRDKAKVSWNFQLKHIVRSVTKHLLKTPLSLNSVELVNPYSVNDTVHNFISHPSRTDHIVLDCTTISQHRHNPIHEKKYHEYLFEHGSDKTLQSCDKVLGNFVDHLD